MSCPRPILLIILFGLSSGVAHGDGGVVRFRAVEGPFIVTIFTASELLQDSPVDVSVMVQERDSNDAILDATVKLTFTPPGVSMAEPVEQVCGVTGTPGARPDSEQFTVAATREQASNKLLYAAPVKFGVTGDWQSQVSIKREGGAVKFACRLPVSPPPRKLMELFPYLVLPPLMVALFVLNQWLHRQLLEKPRWPVMPQAHPSC